MDDLILHARLLVLRRNLETVKRVIDEVETVRDGLRRVLNVWDEDRPRKLLDELEDQVGPALRDGGDSARQRQDDIKKKFEALRGLLTSEELQQAVKSISTRSTELQESALQRTIEDFLVYNANLRLRDIRELEAAFDKRMSDPDEGVRATAAEEAWAEYLELLPRVQEIFAEYVDFLGGLALRDSGYDQGICRLADELGRAFGHLRNVSWNSLTIPARREVLDVTMARIIRLGFPEWSIWALPLAAYGFGSVLVSNVTEFVTFSDSWPSGATCRVRVLMADAFATYVMGPAYACALMLLRLDPVAHDEPGDCGLTQLRAKVVLATLDRLGKESESPVHKEVADRLRGAWNKAVTQIAEKIRTAGEPDTDPEITICDDDISAVVAFVADELYSKELSDSEWEKIVKWEADLRKGRELQHSHVNAKFDGLRPLLNAAWLARLQLDDHKEIRDLTDLATKHWEELEKKQATKKAQTLWSVPSPRRTER